MDWFLHMQVDIPWPNNSPSFSKPIKDVAQKFMAFMFLLTKFGKQLIWMYTTKDISSRYVHCGNLEAPTDQEGGENGVCHSEWNDL